MERSEDKTMLHAIEDMSSQNIRDFCQKRQSHDDVKIEWFAWLVVLGLFITAILETGCCHHALF